MQHFYDDFRIIEPVFTGGSGYKWFGLAAEVLGWTFDPDKDVPPTLTLPMLGNLEDWSCLENRGCFLVKAKPERLADLKKFVIEVKAR